MADTLDTTADGFAILCDREGRVTRVLPGRGTTPEAGVFAPGSLFTTALDAASLPKAGEFLAEIERAGSARGWELNVRSGEVIATMCFAGHTADAAELLVVAARGTSDLGEIYELLAASAPQPIATAVERLRRGDDAPRQTREFELLEELSRLNNELVTMQRELARKNAELQRTDRLKNQFLGIVAHDLRTPLSVIVAYSDFLMYEDSPPLSERQRRFVTSIRTSSQFMVDLVNDLLDVSAIEAGSLAITREPCDLRQVVVDNVEMHRVLGEKKQLSIELSAPEEMPQLDLDCHRIEQVLNNIIGNAIKFSPIGATIRVRLELVDDDVVISVSDRGQGIPDDDIARIFDPFHRSRAKGTAGEKGTGLGLAIARRIVAAHGGRIWVESSEGNGTTFFVSFATKG
jgi:signal transduction histidine kinase